MNDLNLSAYPALKKVRPLAEARYSSGIDGRESKWYIDYSCPNCGKKIVTDDIACDRCGTFFDWRKAAHIRMNPDIVWE